ncbi:methylmalonyl-CoA mutase family protein [Chryseomicrobium sp. FSL W7-1435]|uniref:methylmalonyl-CoA mutase family protein n=1 Tax=Chryseomicrobium sp. FSL W7-1435 TaxID=2921704 RepID=UPI00315A111C
MTQQTPQFEQASFSQWHQLVSDSLKGKDWRTLTTATSEGITIDPLYYELTAVHHDQIEKVQQAWTDETIHFVEPVDSLEVDARTLHKKGADAVTELVYFLVKLDEYYENHRRLPKQIGFSVDTHFFMEVAKLRAARVLWQAFLHAHKLEPTAVALYAETSLRSFSSYDPTVNLLRSANSAFSAVIGGANAVAVHPFDVLTEPTPLGKRLAENIVEVIRHETFVTAVEDPAAGSYAVESLTAQLVDKAWDSFITVQDLPKDEQDAWFTAQSEKAFDTNLQAVASRKHALIGTTIYANPVDNSQTVNTTFDYRRLAEPFETIRAKLQPYSQRVAIIQAGDYKSSKPRVDYVKGYLSVFGWDTEVMDVPQFQQHFRSYDYAVLAGTDEDIAVAVGNLPTSSLTIDVAGKHPEMSSLQQQGIDGSIYMGLSLLDKGHQLVAIWSGKEEAK